MMIHSPVYCLILGEMLDLSISVMIHLSRRKVNTINKIHEEELYDSEG